MQLRARTFEAFDPKRVPSPCFVLDLAALEENLKVLERVGKESGAKILLALKAFSCWRLGGLCARYLDGVSASGLYEARLGNEEFGGEVHVVGSAYREADLREILEFADGVVFNSPSQWRRFRALALAAKAARPDLEFGLRINPEQSEAPAPVYDPCAPFSRLGTVREQLNEEDLLGISGLHFHTLCEQDFPPLLRTLAAVEEKFGDWLPRMNWVNFGGGHHITRPGYQVEDLIGLILDFSEKYGLRVYLEPGEAVALGAGVLAAEVLDLTWNGMDLAILDASAECHLPDVLEMPYRPEIFGAGQPGEFPHLYRLGGPTCLAGDVFGDYSFPEELTVGRRLLFDDMAHYTMVKTNTFNGMPLPALALWDSRTDALEVIREFGYADFKSRLS